MFFISTFKFYQIYYNIYIYIYISDFFFFFFWGGGERKFWIKSSIFESGGDKKFWRDFGAERTLSATIRPIIGHIGRKPTFEILKIWRFWAFQSIFRDFFFQNHSLVQNHPKMTKNGFLELLWILKIIYIYFGTNFEKLKFWFFEDFCQLKPSFNPIML